MSNKATAQSGRLLWVEPNKMDEVSDTGTFDYEDYSICVDLEVRIPKRSACGNETDVITFHTNHETVKDRISFFTGTDGYLTTSFTDITAADPTSNKETLGINSIDITYNSYFYPQVTIRFVDVRGSSLMYPQEDMFKNGTQGSFFKALFCFPYPQFILKVKGFYGKQVQYDLAVEDFKTSFNPETGNFECIVQFIGYMYGIYADLPMSYLLAAPYADYVTNSGIEYWNTQKNKGIFVYDEGTPLDTFIELKYKIKLSEIKISELLQNSETGQKQMSLSTEQEKLEEIDSAISSLLLNISKNDSNMMFKYGKKQIIYCSEKSFSLTSYNLNEWAMLNEKIDRYNFEYPDRKLQFIDVIQGTNTSQVEDDFNKKYGEPTSKVPVGVIAPEFLPEPEPLPEFDITNVQIMWNSSPETTNNDNSLKARLYKNANEFYTKVTDEDLKNELKGYENKENIYAHIFSTNDIFSKIQNRKDLINKELDEVTKNIDAKTKTLYKEELGFTPTISNMFRVIFAHMDTFMQMYYKVLSVINTQKLGTERTPRFFNLNPDNSDLISNENFVPPYPLITKNNGSDKNTAMWPGEYIPASNMEEIKFTESLFHCINTISQKNNNFNKSVLGSNETQFLHIPKGNKKYSMDDMAVNIVPTTLSDLYYFQNPYQIFGVSKEKLTKQALFSTLGYRFNDVMLGKDGSISYDTKGIIEAINFRKFVPTLNLDKAYENEIANMIKNKADYDTVASEFLTYIKSTKENFNESRQNPYHNIEMSPILGGQYYPVNYGDISMVKPGNAEYFPDKKFFLQQIDIKNIGFYWDVLRKTEKEIIDSDRVKYYEHYFGRSYKANDEWWIWEYSEEKGVNHWVGAVAKSLIYGSFNKYFWPKEGSMQNYKMFTMGLFTASSEIDNKKPIRLVYDNVEGYRYILAPKNYKGNTVSAKWAGGQDGSMMYPSPMFESLDSVTKYIKDDMPCYVLDPSKLYGASLYGSEFFYMQNDTLDTDVIVYNGNEYSKKDLAKAYLFLEACAPFGITNLDYNNRVFLLTKWTFLLWGARLLRKGLPDDVDLFNITTFDNTKYILPKKGCPMYVKFTSSDIYKTHSRGDDDVRTIIQIPGFSKGEKSFFDFTCDFSFCKDREFEFIEMFLQWATNDFKILINNQLELRLKNGACIGSKQFKEIFNKVKKDEPIVDLFAEETRKVYSLSKTIYANKYRGDAASLGASDDTEYGFYLFINPKHHISQQLLKYRFDTYLYCPITPNKLKSHKDFSENRIKDGFKKFLTELDRYYTSNSGYVRNGDVEVDSEEVGRKNLTEIMLRNKDLKLSLYLTLKNLYDRWLCGLKRERWKFDYFANPLNDIEKICEFNNFYFIDSFYNDISKKIVVDLNTLRELIDSLMTNRVGDGTYTAKGMKFQGVSIYQFMSSILQKNSMSFLAVPCFNRYKTQDDIKELFTPFSWFDRGEPRGTSYVGLYPHQVSRHLNIEGANGYQYPNDGVDIADINGNFKDTLDIPDLAIIDGGYTMPAFGVTYGKQDQSYFKKVTVNMDSPQVTEYSIGATLDIANNYGENQKVQTFVGQDLYKVYSNHSYTCTVEMMGNAMITPLMYFQLNNIPMFRGAYMVIKVEHSIAQGNMTTVFTGVRISKNKIPFVKATIEGDITDDNLIDNGSGNNDTPTGTGGSNNSGGDSNTTVTPGTPEEVGENVSKVLKYARAAIGIIEYGYDINKRQSEQTIYNKDTAPNGWISNYVPYPSKEKDPDGIYKPIQSDSSDGPQWCCIFISWCAMRAGISPKLSTGAGGWYKGENWDDKYNTQCDAVYNYYKKEAGRVIEMNDNNIVNNPPQPGDFLLKKNTNTKDYPSKLFGHILMVEAYNPETKTITVIHGNASQRVKRETFSFNEVKDTYTHYCRPYYAGDTSSNVPSTGPTTPTTQPSADTSVQSGDDIIITTAEDKLRLINAMIWKECDNINGRTGDTGTTYPAYGILQIRQMMLDDVRVIINRPPSRLKGPYLQNIDSLIPSENLDRDTQVQEFIAVMEWYNKPQNKKTYISNSSIEKDPTQISWSMKYCCAKWNGAVKGKPKEPANPNYFKDVRDKYNILKNDSTKMPEGNSNGWTPDAAFNSFFS